MHPRALPYWEVGHQIKGSKDGSLTRFVTSSFALVKGSHKTIVIVSVPIMVAVVVIIAVVVAVVAAAAVFLVPNADCRQ